VALLHLRPEVEGHEMPEGSHDGDVLADFRVASRPEGPRRARSRVMQVLAPLGLDGPRREALETAVSEAVMNAIEHGNGLDPALFVDIRVTADRDAVVVRIADRGDAEVRLPPSPPDLQARLRGEEPLRGWGLFLMEALVDEIRIERDAGGRVVQLLVWRRDQPTT
jgi:anti-sigma regulatory factor (Ser/Thr protein kinase)